MNIKVSGEVTLYFMPSINHRDNEIIPIKAKMIRTYGKWVEMRVRILGTKEYSISIPKIDMNIEYKGEFNGNVSYRINYNKHCQYDRNTLKIINSSKQLQDLL